MVQSIQKYRHTLTGLIIAWSMCICFLQQNALVKGWISPTLKSIDRSSRRQLLSSSSSFSTTTNLQQQQQDSDNYHHHHHHKIRRKRKQSVVTTALFSSSQPFRYSSDHIRLSAFQQNGTTTTTSTGGGNIYPTPSTSTNNSDNNNALNESSTVNDNTIQEGIIDNMSHNNHNNENNIKNIMSNDQYTNNNNNNNNDTDVVQNMVTSSTYTAELNGEFVELEEEYKTEMTVNNNNNITSMSSTTTTTNTKDGLTQLEANEGMLHVLSIDPSNVDIYERNMTHVAQLEECPIVNVGDMFSNRHFVDMFRGSANYIASHRNTLVVYHIPGNFMDENPVGFRDLMNDISLTWLLGMKIVIVAGCRYQIEKRISDRKTHMGMVVTDPDSLRVVKEEAGYVRFEIERQLARALKGSRGGSVADGTEGNVVSGNFYSAQPFGVLDGVDYKYSGFVRRMESEKIKQVLKNKDIVLLTALGFSPTGEVFNVNSEYLASFAGGALGANKVIYFLERDVALRHKQHGSNIPHMRINDGRQLLEMNGVKTSEKGLIYSDNCPYDGPQQDFLLKMGWGMNALKAGVKRVHLVSPENGALLQELYTRDGSGTMISGDLYDGIHKATVEDVTAIHDLVTPLVQRGILVERTKATLERDISQYHVYTRDGLIVACGQLKCFENGYAEIGCLVVNPAYRAKGRGDAMLGYLERLCVQAGATILFVLSTQTMEWFIERGFDQVGVDMLPASRQATYNHERASKIYMKKINSVRDLDASELFWDR